MAEEAEALVAELTGAEWHWLSEGFGLVSIENLGCLAVPIATGGEGHGVFLVPALPSTSGVGPVVQVGAQFYDEVGVGYGESILVEARFVELDAEAMEGIHLWVGEQGYVDFDGRIPVADGVEAIVEAEFASATSGMSEAPAARGGHGRGRGAGSSGAGPSTKVKTKAPPKPIPAAEFQAMYYRDMGELRRLLEEIKGQNAQAGGGSTAASSAQAAPPGPGPAAGPPSLLGMQPRTKTGGALAEARRLAGVGAGGKAGFSAAVGKNGASPTPETGGVQAAAAQGSESPTEEMVRLLVEALRGGQAPRAAVGSGPALSVEEYISLSRAAMTPVGGEDGASTSCMNARGGQVLLNRLIRTRQERPDVMTSAHESLAKEALEVLPGDSWCWKKYAQQEAEAYVGNFKTLHRFIRIIASCLDEGRSHSYERQHAMLISVLMMLEATAKDGAHNMEWSWPLVGTPDPCGRPRARWASSESTAVAQFHRDEAALEAAKKALDGTLAASPAPAMIPGVDVAGLVKKEVEAALKGKGKGKDKKGKDD